MEEQQAPNVTSGDVERVIRRDFPAEQYDVALTLLSNVGGQDTPRTQLAVLKLADGSLERVAVYAEEARGDWRNVLLWAEQPQANRKLKTPRWRNEAFRQAVYAGDWEQHQAWLNR